MTDIDDTIRHSPTSFQNYFANKDEYVKSMNHRQVDKMIDIYGRFPNISDKEALRCSSFSTASNSPRRNPVYPFDTSSTMYDVNAALPRR